MPSSTVLVYDPEAGLHVITSEEFARSRKKYLLALVEIAPGVERDIVTSVILHQGGLYVPVQDYLTPYRRRPYVLTVRVEDRALIGFDHRGRLWSKGVTVEAVDLSQCTFTLSDGRTVPFTNLARHLGLSLDPLNFPTGWALAWLLHVVPNRSGALTATRPTCPKCGGEGEMTVLQPPTMGFCRQCDVVWRRSEPVELPELERVKKLVLSTEPRGSTS